MPNHLANEASPYLRDHAENPVDWYPWGDEALAKAKAEDKPIFLSIGYSACHWCHVMARESFSDPKIAEILNAHYVCIKVDREERPDVDEIYIEAVRIMTGYDGAIPSGNSIAVMNLLRLARLCGRNEYERAAAATLRRFYQTMLSCPPAFSVMLAGLDLLPSGHRGRALPARTFARSGRDGRTAPIEAGRLSHDRGGQSLATRRAYP
jgi:uncharacterized protein YyaL (SSP411 family)